jgi:hypothetical protein
MKTKNLLLALFFSLIYFGSNAQDVIKTQKTTIRAKVEEIGIDEIKYRDFDNLTGPIIVIDKRDVIEITYENGKHVVYGKDEYEASPEIEVRDKKHAIKFEIFSPMTNDLCFGYESVIKVGINLELKAAIIGPGVSEDNEQASGLFLKAGVKFLTSPTYYRRGVKRSHSLNGWYFKPELIYSSFKTTTIDYYNGTSNVETFENGAINICFGNQHLLGNVCTLDYYMGMGYGFQSNSLDQNPYYYGGEGNYNSYAYSHIFGGPGFPIVLTGGVTFGFIF